MYCLPTIKPVSKWQMNIDINNNSLAEHVRWRKMNGRKHKLRALICFIPPRWRRTAADLTAASSWWRVWWSRSALADGDDEWNTLALAHANGCINTTSAPLRWTLKLSPSQMQLHQSVLAHYGQALRAEAAAWDRFQPRFTRKKTLELPIDKPGHLCLFALFQLDCLK